MCEHKFLKSGDCGAVVQVLCDKGQPISCCGEEMQQLVPNSSEGAGEKHLPVVERSGKTVTVKVGSVFHPMSEEHSIEWVYLQTEKGGQLRCLSSKEEPVAVFALADDEPVAAYAYCNLHGLWKTAM